LFNLSRVQKEVDAGSKPKSDLYDMQLSFSLEEAKILETEQLLNIQKQELFQLINIENITVKDVVLEPCLPADGTAKKEQSSPKIKFAELNYKSSLRDIRVARADNFPRLATYYSYSTFYYKPLNQPNASVANFSQQISDNKNQQVGLQLSVPIFNGFRNNKRIAAAKFEAEKSKLAIEQEKLKIRNQLSVEAQNKENYLQLQHKLKEIQALANTSFLTSQAKFSSGKIDAVIFSTVKNQLLASSYNLLKNELQVQYTSLKINLIGTNEL
ncbi:MAG TPA: TolC family protein, partial [Flavobacterium sp.]|nr:TolC family protein [Flavobacterium sp.]